MLVAKKVKSKTTEKKYTTAKDQDVLKAIEKSNKKHSKMFKMLAK